MRNRRHSATVESLDVIRRGASLIELIVVMGMFMLVLILTGTTIQMLMQSEKVVSHSLVTERTIARVGTFFRDDVHTAMEVTETKDGDKSLLRLTDASGDEVVYLAQKGRLTRSIIEHSKVVLRDDFILPDCQVQFSQDQQASNRFVALVIERPGVRVTKTDHARHSLRKLVIEASLQQQKRLLSENAVTSPAENHVAGKEEQP